MVLELEQSRAVPVSTERAWEVLTTPLEQIFTRRFVAIPPVRGVRDQDGQWGRVGQTRTVLLDDGGTMREELTGVEAGREFGYRIDGVTGPMKALVSTVEGRWAFTPAGTGVRITWAWTVHPAHAFVAPALPVFAWMWRGYARQALERLETLLLEP